MIRFFFILIALASNYISLAQTIKGIVVDSLSQEPIPSVNIYSSKFNYGTVTNIDGEFTLDEKENESEITFSHLSFQTKKIIVASENPFLRITLQPRINLLSEVIVSDEGYKIAKKTLARFKENQSFSFGKAFYRQTTTLDKTPTEFFETFDLVSISPSGIEKYRMYESRYARTQSSLLKDSLHFVYNNLSYLSFGFHVFSKEKTKNKSIVSPFRDDSFDLFNFSVKGHFEIGGVKYVIVEYLPLDNLTRPSISGEFTVNLATGCLINFTANTKSNLGIDTIKGKKNGQIIKMPVVKSTYNWIINFNDDNQPSLNYINLSATIDFSFRDGIKKASANSTLLIFEKNLKEPNDLKEAKIEQVDIDKIRKQKYHSKFWKDNPVIKRTHFEDEVISFFEKSNSFSNFLK